ncbi:hypothetical protein [Echinicola rosea]|nr:hypothetical protein [Echinicola rosea]
MPEWNSFGPGFWLALAGSGQYLPQVTGHAGIVRTVRMLGSIH